MKYVIVVLIFCGWLEAQESHEFNLDPDVRRMEHEGKGGHHRGKGRRGGGRLKKAMESQVPQWMGLLPAEQAEQAQKIVQYLHTSNEVSRMYVRSGELKKAQEILEKRVRLKLPDFFSTAPPLLRSSKVHSLMELGVIFGKLQEWDKAIQNYEAAMEIMKVIEVPMMVSTRLRMELLKAYKKAGLESKAALMMQSTLKDSEIGLDFE